jgi:hypothetical protein
MTLWMANLLVTTFETYALAGVVFAVAFLPRAIVNMDAGLRGAPVAVRLLIFPGVVAFWPLFAWRWMTGRTAPAERTAHRHAAVRTNR